MDSGHQVEVWSAVTRQRYLATDHRTAHRWRSGGLPPKVIIILLLLGYYS